MTRERTRGWLLEPPGESWFCPTRRLRFACRNSGWTALLQHHHHNLLDGKSIHRFAALLVTADHGRLTIHRLRGMDPGYYVRRSIEKNPSSRFHKPLRLSARASIGPRQHSRRAIRPRHMLSTIQNFYTPLNTLSSLWGRPEGGGSLERASGDNKLVAARKFVHSEM